MIIYISSISSYPPISILQSVASYSDLKRLSSWFGNDDDDDLFPTAASTTTATTASSSQDATIPTATASGPPDLMNDLTHDTNNKKIIEMHKLTLVAEEDCVFYLESMNWDVSAAVKSYYDCLR